MTSNNIFNAEQNQLHYQISAADIKQHLYQVKLQIQQPKAKQQIYLPVWIAGSYLVREFSKHLQSLQANQGGQAIEVQQLDKNNWQLLCSADAPVEVSYQVYAFDNSVRAAWLDSSRAFFNGTSVFTAVQGMEEVPLNVSIDGFSDIAAAQVATALTAVAVDDAGFGRYRADSYQQLIDSPVEISNFQRGRFELAGVEHQIIVTAATANFDLERLTADVAKICQAQMQLWQPSNPQPSMSHYCFLLNVVGQGYGGLEHRNSTALICSRKDLPLIGTATASKEYKVLLGLFSHEYFHSWNVKRLRPFANINYNSENYTELLWFFEGITSYYDDLCLYRAGCIDTADYLLLVEGTINRIQQTPGRKVHSLAQASFEAWTKFYRQDENSLNATVTYYGKGSLLALCLDLTLRQQYNSNLDLLLQQLWRQHGDAAISYADILAALQSITKVDCKALLDTWVYGCDDLPIQQLLQQQGVDSQLIMATPEQQLGLQLQAGKTAAGLLKVKAVLSGGYAQQAGLAAGDEIMAINNWRINDLAELPLYVAQTAAADASVELLVSRDARVHQLQLTIPNSLLGRESKPQAISANTAEQFATNYQLKIADEAKIKQWIG